MVVQPNSPDNRQHADQAKAARASKLCVHGCRWGEVQKRKVWIRKLSRCDVLASAIWPGQLLFTGRSGRSGKLKGDHGLRPARVSTERQLRDDWPYPRRRKAKDGVWRRNRDFQRAKIEVGVTRARSSRDWRARCSPSPARDISTGKPAMVITSQPLHYVAPPANHMTSACCRVFVG